MSIAHFAPELMIIRVNGFTFDALVAGPETGSLILLLHGFPQFADSWSSMMGPLAAAGHRVVAVNQRGYSEGARPVLVSDYARERLVSDVMGFADELGAFQYHLVAMTGAVQLRGV